MKASKLFKKNLNLVRKLKRFRNKLNNYFASNYFVKDSAFV